MSAEVMEKLKSLPPEKQQEVEDFVDYLSKKYAPPKLSAAELMAKRKQTFGSGKGQVWMADDFNETPEDFKDYM